MKTYKVIAHCNPYDSRRHYNGQKVVEYNIATPTAWVIADGLTLDQARKTLGSILIEKQDVIYEDAETMEGQREALRSDLEDEDCVDELDSIFAWYTVPGYYQNNELIFDPAKDLAFSYDTMTYCIE